MSSTGVTVEMRPGDLAALEQKLRKLAVRSQRTVLRKGTRAASTPIMGKIRAATPVGPTGGLEKSIGRKFKFYRRSTTDVAVIGPRIGTNKKFKGFIGWIVEFGTKLRSTKAGKSTGRMPPNPFAKKAAESIFAKAGQAGVTALKKALETEIRRLRGGG